MAAMNIIAPARKTAIVLFNLGGPDRPSSVQPFLFNLFNDPAIIGLPNPFRRFLASFISKRRAPTAQKIYEEIGGKSPILENTLAQAQALEASLQGHGQVKIFTVMRYWHPMADAVVKQVKTYAPEHIILLPLYPQFSTTTTGSSFGDWARAAKEAGLDAPTSRVCCYPQHPEFVKAHAQLIRTYYQEASQFGRPRILFSAHGLPEKIIKKGDPYQAQVEASTQAILKILGIADVDYVNCYQSRVGPLKWIGPATTDELARAGADQVPVVLVPIAFVSEHSETLVELDIEYAELAHENGIDHYYRVPTLSVQAHFIAALADICLKLTVDATTAPDSASPRCGREWSQCPCRNQGA
jgi:ferrochelatase